jgi:hypothetical protein
MSKTRPKPRNKQKRDKGNGANNKGKSHWKKIKIFVTSGIIEALSFVLEQKADEFTGVQKEFLHWLSECGMLFGGVFAAHRLWKSFCWRCAFWFVFIGACALLLVFRPQKTAAPNPIITLHAMPNFDPTIPFITSPVLENEGPGTIYHVKWRAWLNDTNTAAWRIIFTNSNTPEIPHLAPRKPQTIEIQPGIAPPVIGPSTFLNVDIIYTPEGWSHETNTLFRFKVALGTDGKYAFIEEGDGETLDEVKAEISRRPLHFIDVVPLLDVRILSIEDISATNSHYPLAITYSWKNVSGMPVTQVYITWAAWTAPDSEIMKIMTWEVETNEPYFNQLLIPGQWRWERRIYTSGPFDEFRNLYGGIMSGKLMLTCMILEIDQNGGKWWTLVAAIPTSNGFQMMYEGPHMKQR